MQSLNVREWYMAEYPTDQFGEKIKKGVTFSDVFNALLSGKCVYKLLLGKDVDSVIRERVFTKLAELKNVEYYAIYDLWLNA